MNFKYRGPREIFQKRFSRIPKYTICWYCEVNSANSWDHILPYSYGGTEEKENLIACCMGCNLILSNILFYSVYEEKKLYIKFRIGGSTKKKSMEKITFLRRHGTLPPGSMMESLRAWIVGLDPCQFKLKLQVIKMPVNDARRLKVQSGGGYRFSGSSVFTWIKFIVSTSTLSSALTGVLKWPRGRKKD